MPKKGRLMKKASVEVQANLKCSHKPTLEYFCSYTVPTSFKTGMPRTIVNNSLFDSRYEKNNHIIQFSQHPEEL